MGKSTSVRELDLSRSRVASAFPPGVRSVPHSVAAEQALLGAVMVNNGLYDVIAGSLRPEHFYIPLHASVYEAVEKVINGRGVEANPINVHQELKSTPFNKEDDLFPHLSSMFENAGLASDIKSLAQVIQTTCLQRQMMGLADSLKAEAEKADSWERGQAVVEQAGDELFRLTGAGQSSTMRPIRDSLREMLELAELAKRAGGGVTGIGSGLIDLDRLLGGFQRSDLIILGARPSMGKTSLLLNIAHNAAKALVEGKSHGAAVGVLSLEMSCGQLMQRMAAGAAGIDSQRIANGQLGDTDIARLTHAAAELAELPLHVDDKAGMSVQEMRARARQMKRQYGIGLLVVDYLQLATSPSKRSDVSRVQEVSDISMGLKQIARDLEIPVLAASQLSRNVESRDNKRPLLADLRESGSIEQDADLVMFLYRPEYYIKQQLGGGIESNGASDAERRRSIELADQLEQMKGLTELIVAKNRKGPTDTVKLLFQPETTTFRNYASG